MKGRQIMQCQCIRKFGTALRAEERPGMTPTGSEVILEVIAAGVCHTDLHLREGGVDLGRGQRLEYAARGIGLPLTPGHEVVGRVIAAGPDAGPVDRDLLHVVYPWCGCGTCPACLAGNEHQCAAPRYLGVYADGGYATRLRVAHPRYLFDIGTLAPEVAAPLACSGLTTWSALRKLGDLPRQRPALLIGAGGLGLMCIGLMQALDMQPPVVADIDPAKRAAALQAGACAAIDPQAPDALGSIASACRGAPLAVVDFVGAETTAALGFDAVGKGGTLVTVGLFGGAAPWSLPLIAMKSVRIQGSYVGSLSEFGELMQLARKGAIRPIPTSCHPLTQANAVMDRLEAGGIVGRAVLTPATA